MHMTSRISRRFLLQTAFAGLASPALALAPETSVRPLMRTAPEPKPSGADIVTAYGLRGRVAFALADLETGDVLDTLSPTQPMAPASVTKAMTAAFALDRLGAGHRFTTQILATGDMVDGVLNGDLILLGSGDPTLNTDRLGDLLLALREQGMRRVNGRLILNGGGFPYLRQIDPRQPPQVGYNPAIAGLNLNFNRIRFDWTRWDDIAGYKMTMRASGKRFEPDVSISRIIPVERDFPVYSHRLVTGGEEWEVARPALGREGGRWIPTRVPMQYAGEAFRGIARQVQIQMPEPIIDAVPDGARVLAETHSDPLTDIARDMLRFSTNLTAEVLGFAGSGQPTLDGSAGALSDWCAQSGMTGRFVDHSGLGVDSQVTAGGLMRFMLAQKDSGLQGILRDMSNNAQGRARAPGAQIFAKTGSLNFVSTLSGYLIGQRKSYAFAILTDDLPSRARIAPDDRERPAGSGTWAKRSRTLQYQLLANWVA